VPSLSEGETHTVDHERSYKKEIDYVIDHAKLRESNDDRMIAHGPRQEPRVVIRYIHALKAEDGGDVMEEEACFAHLKPFIRETHLIDLDEAICDVVENASRHIELVEEVPVIDLNFL